MDIKKITKRLFTGVIFIMLFVFFGCSQPFSIDNSYTSAVSSVPVPVPTDNPKMAVVKLNTDNEDARSIMPNVTEDSFNSFIVFFVASTKQHWPYIFSHGKTRPFIIEGKLEDVLKTEYVVEEGYYDKVEVLAFYTPDGAFKYSTKGETTHLGATGENRPLTGNTDKEFLVEIGKHNNLTLDMDIYHNSGINKKGYFRWNLDNSNNNLGTGDTATIKIYSYPRKNNPVPVKTINLINNFTNMNGEALDSGVYEVYVLFSRTDCIPYDSESKNENEPEEYLHIAPGGAPSLWKWKIPKLTSLIAKVSYYYNDGDPVVTDYLRMGSSITRIPTNRFDPTEEFKGWYKDAALTKQWKNSYDILVSDTALYAKWGPDRNDITSVNPPGIVLKKIPAGSFTMGTPASEGGGSGERPQHTVSLTGFYMSKYEITQEQYVAVMGTNPSYFKTSPVAGDIQGKRPVEYLRWYEAIVFCNKLSLMEGLYPVYTIKGSIYPDDWGAVPTIENDPDWNNVKMDISKNGYRLPTEAEWEYACRAGTLTAYNTGDTISDRTGWYGFEAVSGTREVGKKPANNWGLFDMHGNVNEWCWDWNVEGYYSESPVNDPEGPLEPAKQAGIGSYLYQKIYRGGSYRDVASNLRSGRRLFGRTSQISVDWGFRIVRR